MPTIRSSGLASGLDIDSIVRQLVAAEREPFQLRLSRQGARVERTISALGLLKGGLSQLQGALSSLKTEAAFQARKTTSQDSEIFSATASASAVPGSYNVQVAAIAQAHKIASGAFAAGPSAVVGTGTLTIAVGSQSFAVTIDATNNTVTGIRDAINGGAANTGVQATVISAADGARLVLSARTTGADNALVVTQTGGDGGLATLVHNPGVGQSLQVLVAAQNASLTIDGYSVTSTTNTIEGAIEGVTLTLHDAEPGTQLALSVENDTPQVIDRVKKFVADFNALAATFATLRKFSPGATDQGPLFGDSMLRNIEASVRAQIGNEVTGLTSAYTTLASVGITTQADGSLKLDETRLRTALGAGFDGVGRLFGSTGGVANRLDSLLTATLDAGAALADRSKSLEGSKKSLQQSTDSLERRMEAIETRYRAQFASLDSLLAGLQSTSRYLESTLLRDRSR